MRTLAEIVTLTKENERLEYDELRYAVCALSSLLAFARNDMMRLSEAERKGKPHVFCTPTRMFDEQFDRTKQAFSISPKQWLGWAYDPENPDYVTRQKAAQKLFEKHAHQAENKERTTS